MLLDDFAAAANMNTVGTYLAITCLCIHTKMKQPGGSSCLRQ